MANYYEETISLPNHKLKILTNDSKSKKLLICFHGLDGSKHFANPIFKNLGEDFKIVSPEQRGHHDVELKSSRSLKKHLKDYLAIVEYYKKQNYDIWLMGESMGGAYVVLFADKYQNKNLIKGIFVQSIPNKLINTLESDWKNKIKIYFYTVFCFFTNLNFKYKAVVNYELFSNNKTIKRITKLADKEKYRYVKEGLCAWKGIQKSWKILEKNYSSPIPIFYFLPSDDIMAREDKVEKIFTNKRNYFLKKIPDTKHILVFEKNFFQVTDTIKNHLEQN